MLTMYRAHDRAIFAHNVALTFTTRNRLPLLASDDTRQALAEFFRETDNYGLDKIRGILISDSAVTVIVSVPPSRSVAQVAQRLKGGSSFDLLRDLPALADRLSGRGLWQRGYTSEVLGARSVDWLRGYLAGKEGKRA